MKWLRLLFKWLCPCDRPACQNGCVCGKGETQITYPQAAPAPSTADAVNAWVAAMPTVFAEQQRQAPLEAAQQMELVKQFSTPLAQALQETNKAISPETTKVQENLSAIANKGMNATEMPDWMRKQYLSDFNAQIGNNAASPIGADYVSRGMQNQLFEQQKYYQQLGAQAAGLNPATSTPASSATPQTTNYASTFTPSSVMNYAQQGYATNAQASRPLALQDTRKYGLGWLLSM